MGIYDFIMSTPALADAVHTAQAGTPQRAHRRNRPLTDAERRARNRGYSRTYYWKTRRPDVKNFCTPLID